MKNSDTKECARGYPKTLIAGSDAKCFLRVTQVMELLAIARSTLFKMVKDGRFPRPYKQGYKISVWKREDVDNYINKICLDTENKSSEQNKDTRAKITSYDSTRNTNNPHTSVKETVHDI